MLKSKSPILALVLAAGAASAPPPGLEQPKGTALHDDRGSIARLPPCASIDKDLLSEWAPAPGKVFVCYDRYTDEIVLLKGN